VFFLLPDSGFGIPNPALILIATNVRMEIPELVPSNSRRNTSKNTFEKSKAATKRQLVAALLPLYRRFYGCCPSKRQQYDNKLPL
jgi:hypothetical protein